MKNTYWKMVAFLGVTTLLLALFTFGGAALAYGLTRTDSNLEFTQLAADVNPEAGLVIVAVDPDGPAAEAGVVRGDILQGFNDAEIDTMADLHAALAGVSPGDEVTLTILHGDDIRTLSALPGDRDGKPYLGLTPYGGMPDFMRFFGDKLRAVAGAVISDVLPDTPAEQAGLEVGDMILAVDGDAVTAERSLADLIGAHQPGDEVVLKIQRPGQDPREVTVTLSEHPDKAGAAYLGVGYAPGFGRGMFDFKDMPFERIPPDAMPFGDKGQPHPDLPQPLTEQGAVIISVTPDSPAAEAGLEKGAIIVAIDGEEVDSPEAVVEKISQKSPGDAVTITVKDKGAKETKDVAVILGEHPQKQGAGYLGVEIGVYLRMEGVQNGEVPLPDMFRFGHPQGRGQFNFHWDGLPFDLDRLPFDLNQLPIPHGRDLDQQSPTQPEAMPGQTF